MAFVGINVYNGNPNFYRDLLMPTGHRLVDPEVAHVMAIKLAKYKVVPKVKDFTSLPDQAKILVSKFKLIQFNLKEFQICNSTIEPD